MQYRTIFLDKTFNRTLDIDTKNNYRKETYCLDNIKDRHHAEGPAVSIISDETLEFVFYKNGQISRPIKDGPAQLRIKHTCFYRYFNFVEVGNPYSMQALFFNRNFRILYFKNNVLHRDHGPSNVFYDGTSCEEAYFENGNFIKEVKGLHAPTRKDDYRHFLNKGISFFE